MLRASVRTAKKTLNDIHDSNVRNGHLITMCGQFRDTLSDAFVYRHPYFDAPFSSETSGPVT